jgi:predicted metal-dependent phosphoesterase TrpH
LSTSPLLSDQIGSATTGVTVFAHPAASARGAVVDEAAIAAFAAAGLNGLEVDHPDHDDETRTALRRIAVEYGLLVTGSSDYHGSVKEAELGANTTAPDVFDALAERATGSRLVST